MPEPPGPPPPDLETARAILRRLEDEERQRSRPRDGGRLEKVIGYAGAASTVGGVVWAIVALDPTGLAISVVGLSALGLGWWRERRRSRAEEALQETLDALAPAPAAEEGAAEEGSSGHTEGLTPNRSA